MLGILTHIPASLQRLNKQHIHTRLYFLWSFWHGRSFRSRFRAPVAPLPHSSTASPEGKVEAVLSGRGGPGGGVDVPVGLSPAHHPFETSHGARFSDPPRTRSSQDVEKGAHRTIITGQSAVWAIFRLTLPTTAPRRPPIRRRPSAGEVDPAVMERYRGKSRHW